MQQLRRYTPALVALGLTGTMMVTGATSASAQPAERAKPTKQVLAKGLVGPLSLAVSRDGTRYFAQNFASLLMKQEPGGEPEVIFAPKRKGLEPGAVSVDGDRVMFTVSGRNNTVGRLNTFGPRGKAYTVADLYAFEKRADPDGDTTYGFRKVPKSCRDQVEGLPALYNGIKETHPYATLIDGGTTYVADAGANAIVKVGPGGRVSAVAALPAMPTKITEEAAESFGLPDCVVGEKYWFEPVPTDIEMGRDGWLYVTSLPGGPEDPVLGARGSVLKLNPATGRVSTVAKNLFTPTGLAVGPRGGIFVSQLFAGNIVRITSGQDQATPFLSVPLPSDVEFSAAGLFALVNALPGEDAPPNGKLIRIRF